MTTVLKDPSVAVDRLLDARGAIRDVHESTLAGTALYNVCNRILADIDSAIAGLRRPK